MSADADPGAEGALGCPSCGARHPASERFCANCGMPLVELGRVPEEPASESRRRARKVKPQYLGGNLVKVGWARNQAEAELLQGLLLEEGIPSILRRTQGFDVPQFLAAGPRDLLVSEAAYTEARELLSGAVGDVAEADAVAPLGGIGHSPARLVVWVLVTAAAVAGIVYALYELAG